MPASFSDNAYSTGDFTTEWTSARFTITPLEGPAKNKPLKLSGVREMSGMGFAAEGVNILYGSDGASEGVKITKGRIKPNEITLKLDMLVFENTVGPMVCPIGRTPYKFNFTYQQVDPGGVATFTRKWVGCVRTGLDTDTPSDNEHTDSFKFQPTKRR
jgi:hypothetical protein